MKIAIVKLTSMGDIIHALPSVHLIKKYFPDSKTDWVVDSSMEEIPRLSEEISEIFTISLRGRALTKSMANLRDFRNKMKNRHYDHVIDLQGLLKSAVVASMVPGVKSGFSAGSSREFLSSFFYERKFRIPYSENVVSRNLRLTASALGINISGYETAETSGFLRGKFQAGEDIKRFFRSSGKNILLVLSASTPERVLPVGKYVEFSRKMDARFLMTWGNQKEREIAEKLKNEIPDSVVIPHLPVRGLCEIISCCSLVTGPDTGPMNLPWALGVPSLTIYWSGARNSASRNSVETEINRTLTFENLGKADCGLIAELAHEIIEPSD